MNNKKEQVRKLNENLQRVKLKQIKGELLLNAIKHSEINRVIRDKITEIVLTEELGRASQVLALGDLENVRLTSKETSQLTDSMDKTLLQQKDILEKQLVNTLMLDTDNVLRAVEDIAVNKQLNEKKLRDKQEELREAHKDLVQVFIQYGNLLAEFVQFKTEKVPAKVVQAAAFADLKSEMHNYYAQVQDIKVRIKMFNPTSGAVDTYIQALKDLRAQRNDYKCKIQALQTELDQRKLLEKDVDYQKILKEYRQLKENVDQLLFSENSVFVRQ